MRALSLICFILFHSVSMFSQDLSTRSNRAARFYLSGTEQFDLMNFDEALRLFERAISADNEFIEAYLLAGDVSFEIKDYRKAAEYYERAASIDPDFFPAVFINIGDAWMAVGEYEKACGSFRRLSKKEDISEGYRRLTS